MNFKKYLKVYRTDEYPMNRIYDIVEKTIQELKFGKKYTLRQIVCKNHPEIWEKLNKYQAKSIGYTFAIYMTKFGMDGLVMYDNEPTNKKYIRTEL